MTLKQQSFYLFMILWVRSVGSVRLGWVSSGYSGWAHSRLPSPRGCWSHMSGSGPAVGRDGGGHWVMSHLSSGRLGWGHSHGGGHSVPKSKKKASLSLCHIWPNWPKQIEWLSSESLGNGVSQRHGYGKAIIAERFANNVPQRHSFKMIMYSNRTICFYSHRFSERLTVLQ